MSDTAEAERTCAHCGLIDGNLRRCCDETFYCNVTCQKMHRKVHKTTCENTNFSKKKRTDGSSSGKANNDSFATVGASRALAVDDGYDSFGDDESDIDIDSYECPPRDDCPVCMDALPTDNRKTEYMACCGKLLCQACSLDHANNSIERGVDDDTWIRCVFCRGKCYSYSSGEGVEQLKAAAERGDGNAVFLLATGYENGQYGLSINYQKAVELYHQATKLGNANAAHTLGWSYMSGDIVRMDKKKARRLFCREAKGGSVGSLHQLGCMKFKEVLDEGDDLDFLSYFFAAAELGWKDSTDQIKRLHDCGLVSEDDYKRILRSYLDAVKKEQTPSRDKVLARINEERARRNERPIG